MPANPTRWTAARRIVAAAAASGDVYVPASPGDVLEVRQLRVASSAAAEVIVYWSTTTTTPAAATAIPEADIVFGVHLAANGGASPDLSCLGAWAPAPGRRLRVWISAAATVNVAAEGLVSD